MGYPMTWLRVIMRNGLQDGDYGFAPAYHCARVITDPTKGTAAGIDETKLARFDGIATRVEEYQKAFMRLAGDIRRLERDAVDENSLCLQISNKTDIDTDTVAAVLKEFFAI